MKTQKDPIDIADALVSDLDYMRILLHAAEDKVQFYFCNKPLLGPCEELLSLQARELDDLLLLAGRFLEKMEQKMDAVADLLCGIEPPPAGIENRNVKPGPHFVDFSRNCVVFFPKNAGNIS